MAARVSAIEAVGAADPSAKPTLPSRLSALLRSLVPCSSGAPGAATAAGISSIAVPPAVRGRQVQGRAGVEEAERPEGEADPIDRHDRPVLGPRDVMAAQGVPEHDVGVLDRP